MLVALQVMQCAAAAAPHPARPGSLPECWPGTSGCAGDAPSCRCPAGDTCDPVNGGTCTDGGGAKHSTTLYGGGAPVDLVAAGSALIDQLDATKGIFHANLTLWTSHASSFHLFATNRTEPCHWHPGTTLASTLAGRGAFFVPYTAPQPQNSGDSFFIPIGEPHAFGPAEEGSGPVLVSVLWTPPFHPGYLIPVDGCRMKVDDDDVEAHSPDRSPPAARLPAPTVTVAPGVELPLVVLGTGSGQKGDVQRATALWLGQAGGVGIDTAFGYGDEVSI